MEGLHIERHKKGFSSAQIIMIGFAGTIFLGSLLLMLPFATKDGCGAAFADALFTATSAVCVTGLIVKDTATYWSIFGQTIILLLIQIGGMGVITVALAVSMASGKKISLRQRSVMQDSVSALHVGGVVKFTGFILKMIFLFELIGAMLMAPVFIGEFGFGKGLWYAVFHSISAFCNAGFDLMGIRTPYSSLTYFVKHPLINIVIMALIVIGGIGFLTWEDMGKNKLHIKRYRMQSKVILLTTFLLILLPALYFFFFEFSESTIGERLFASLFQAVTPRTAGFNTVDLTLLSETGIGIIIILMIIGGSPGSTAGGMKTTTFAVLTSTAVSVFRRRRYTHFFGRRVEEETVREAATILTMYLVLFLTGGFVISRVEQLPLLPCLFEAGSAIGTVGLTLGITPDLSLISRLILIGQMYFGRVGGLTIIFAALSGIGETAARFPKEALTVG